MEGPDTQRKLQKVKTSLAFYGILVLVIIAWASFSSLQIAISGPANLSLQRDWKEIIWNNGVNATCNDNVRIRTIILSPSLSYLGKGNCDMVWLVLLPGGEYSFYFGKSITAKEELSLVEYYRANVSAVVLDDYHFNMGFFNQIYFNLSKIAEVMPVLYYFSLAYFPQILENPVSSLYATSYSTHVILAIRPSSLINGENNWNQFTRVAIAQTETEFPNIKPFVLVYSSQTSFWSYPIPKDYLNGVGNGSYYSAGLVIWSGATKAV